MPRKNKGAKAAASKKGNTSKSAKAKVVAAEKLVAASKFDDGENKMNVESHRFSTGVLISQPTARDVKIGNFSIMSHGRQLVQDALLELTIGRKYGLLGPNGSGKSTFLQCLAHREVPIPKHIDIFHLEEEYPPTEMTALEAAVDHMRRKVTRLEAEADSLMEEYGPDSDALQAVYDRLDDMDPSTFEVRASRLLLGLGFEGEMMKKMTKDMSGGWRMRVSLAQALLEKPMLLLLDEPTNHLDLEACVWLERYLQTEFHNCLIVISHSQDFLNNVCTNIIHITPQQKLAVYGGNYDAFMKTKSEQETNQFKQYKKEQEDIKHIKQFISSCGTFSNLVKQAKSKQKILDKMYDRGLTPMPAPEAKYNFRFPEVERLSPPVLAFYDVSFSYSGLEKDYLFRATNLSVDQDSRIALVGKNGVGKSTLVKLMAGELTPSLGQVRRHINLVMGRYHQHSLEQLDVTMSPLEFMKDRFPHMEYEETQWRSFVGRYGITGSLQKSKIGTMSDGQKSRLVFAMLSVGRPNILLLDEPTNHLDMSSIDGLADAINNFNGGVVLVSHDFRLIQQVAKTIWEVKDKHVETFDGTIREYKDILAESYRP